MLHHVQDRRLLLDYLLMADTNMTPPLGVSQISSFVRSVPAWGKKLKKKTEFSTRDWSPYVSFLVFRIEASGVHAVMSLLYLPPSPLI